MSDYASRQRNSRNHVAGLSVVVLLHLLIAWAVNSGLTQNIVKIVRGPVEAQLVEEKTPDLCTEARGLSQICSRFVANMQPLCRTVTNLDVQG